MTITVGPFTSGLIAALGLLLLFKPQLFPRRFSHEHYRLFWRLHGAIVLPFGVLGALPMAIPRDTRLLITIGCFVVATAFAVIIETKVVRKWRRSRASKRRRRSAPKRRPSRSKR